MEGVKGGIPVTGGGEEAATGEGGTTGRETGGATEEGVSSTTPSHGGSVLLDCSAAPLLSPIFLLLEFSFLNIVPAHETNEHERVSIYKIKVYGAYEEKTSKHTSTLQADLAKGQHKKSPHHPKRKNCGKES